jgi:hypothetical protein
MSYAPPSLKQTSDSEQTNPSVKAEWFTTRLFQLPKDSLHCCLRFGAALQLVSRLLLAGFETSIMPSHLLISLSFLFAEGESPAEAPCSA